MKRSLFWICLITFIFLASAQELSAKDWEYQKSGTTSNLTAVSFADNNHGWAVGENGAILATSDGGLNWKILSPELLDQVSAVVSSYSRTMSFPEHLLPGS